MEMTASEYEKLWLSEGGGQPYPSYEEVVVHAFPYNLNGELYLLSLSIADGIHLSPLSHRKAPPFKPSLCAPPITRD